MALAPSSFGDFDAIAMHCGQIMEFFMACYGSSGEWQDIEEQTNRVIEMLRDLQDMRLFDPNLQTRLDREAKHLRNVVETFDKQLRRRRYRALGPDAPRGLPKAFSSILWVICMRGNLATIRRKIQEQYLAISVVQTSTLAKMKNHSIKLTDALGIEITFPLCRTRETLHSALLYRFETHPLRSFIEIGAYIVEYGHQVVNDTTLNTMMSGASVSISILLPHAGKFEGNTCGPCGAQCQRVEFRDHVEFWCHGCGAASSITSREDSAIGNFQTLHVAHMCKRSRMIPVREFRKHIEQSSRTLKSVSLSLSFPTRSVLSISNPPPLLRNSKLEFELSHLELDSIVFDLEREQEMLRRGGNDGRGAYISELSFQTTGPSLKHPDFPCQVQLEHEAANIPLMQEQRGPAFHDESDNDESEDTESDGDEFVDCDEAGAQLCR